MAQIDKNTVDAQNQLDISEFVSCFGNEKASLRVMFVGNSITRHKPLASIGWSNDCGMAASSIENDYVHILSRKILSRTDAYFCVCQVAEWERMYVCGTGVLAHYEAARDFCPDVIIMRAVENCTHKNHDAEKFTLEYKNLLNYLNKASTDKIVITSSFWRHPADKELEAIAKDLKLDFIELSDLGELDEMKAVGHFEHEGVASHPGDLGMKTISERIWKSLEKMF